VNRIVLDITNSLQEELNDHGVETRYELTTELPLVNGHGAQLGEVVFNLINNAIEALAGTTNRSRMLRVRTEVCGRDEIAVSVQDSGPGIDPRELDNVFNAFVSTKAHGTGLGLAICRMIVEGHGGRLTASSDGKSGALFQFVLPIGSTDTFDAAMRLQAPWINKLSEGLQVEDIETTHGVMTALRRKLEGNKDDEV
jgi:signal transduction histidine kinase